MTPPAWLGQDWLAPHYLGWMAQGALLTAWLAVQVCLAATVLGALLAVAHDHRRTSVRHAVRGWLGLHRNTPLMVQLLIWYFGVASCLPDAAMQWLNTPRALTLGGLSLGWPSFEWLAAWVALTWYSAAFIAEEVRAGVRGVAPGQYAAALALGMSHWQALRWIVLPQALRLAWRPLLGQYLTVIKNTSLTMAIGVAELSYTSRQVETETLLTFQAFAVASALYLLLVLGAQWVGLRPRTGRPA